MINRIQQVVNKDIKVAVGLMSGTSLDGIDAALVEIKNSGSTTKVKLVEFITLPFSEEERSGILDLCAPSTSSVDKICHMNVYLGKKMAMAAIEVARKAARDMNEIDFISSHGQTIYHMPEKAATMQIGELAVIAAETGCLTVGDFRPSDMAYGGQGAPLVPFVDYLLFKSHDNGRALINIGGISNISIIQANAAPDEVAAFDMGPGNMLIDAIVKKGTDGKKNYDQNGEIAQKGSVCESWLEKILERDRFLPRKPPKSTGREQYGAEFAKKLWIEGNSLGLSFEDIVATITAYTYRSIILHFKEYIDEKYKIDEVFVGGGGAYNKHLMNNLKKGLKQNVSSMEEFNFSSDAKEAIAFAILGNELIHGSANNLPSATGASKSVIMGKLALP